MELMYESKHPLGMKQLLSKALMFQWPLEDVPPRVACVDGRGDYDVGYTREQVFDDQVVRVGWRDGKVLNGGGDLVSSLL